MTDSALATEPNEFRCAGVQLRNLREWHPAVLRKRRDNGPSLAAD
jgi:hypothetical protein